MNEHEYQVIPYKSVGEYRFGMSREECTKALGRPEREKNDLPMGWFREYRGQVEAVFKGNKLILVYFGKGERVIVAGCSVLEDPGALETLMAHDKGSKMNGPYYLFPKLGLCVGGLGKRRIPEGKFAIIYARNQSRLMEFFGTV